MDPRLWFLPWVLMTNLNMRLKKREHQTLNNFLIFILFDIYLTASESQALQEKIDINNYEYRRIPRPSDNQEQDIDHYHLYTPWHVTDVWFSQPLKCVRLSFCMQLPGRLEKCPRSHRGIWIYPELSTCSTNNTIRQFLILIK